MRPVSSWSRDARRPGRLAVFALVAACSAFPQVASLDQARARLTGMSESQVIGCMGAPGSRIAAPDGRAVWTFTPGPDAMSPPQPVTDPAQATFGYAPFSGAVGGQSVAAAVAPPARASCMVVLSIANGLVAGVNYTGPDGGPPTRPEACGAIAGRCLP